jgi:Tfp pilus assembly protein PilO
VKTALQKPKIQIAVACGAGFLIAVAGWLLLVSPQRTKADDLQTQISSVQSSIDTRRAALAAKPRIDLKSRASDLYRLTKAVPDDADTTGVILSLDRLAKSSGVSFRSIAPAQPIVGQGYDIHPLNVVVAGRYSQLSGFLHSVRKLVTVHNRKLDARGRLFSVEALQLREADGDSAFPNVAASFTLQTFVYSNTPVPGTAPTTSTPTDNAAPSSGAVAAGATH